MGQCQTKITQIDVTDLRGKHAEQIQELQLQRDREQTLGEPLLRTQIELE